MPAHRRVEDRFWSKVDRRESGCWLWRASLLTNGYGQFGLYKGRMWKAHRVAWELTYGPIPRDTLVCHHCDTPACVRPDHLFLGSHQDNRDDCRLKGRTAKGANNGIRRHPDKLHRMSGETHALAKLTADEVAAIRALRAQGQTQRALANRFGVSQSQICRIVQRQRWR